MPKPPSRQNTASSTPTSSASNVSSGQEKASSSSATPRMVPATQVNINICMAFALPLVYMLLFSSLYLSQSLYLTPSLFSPPLRIPLLPLHLFVVVVCVCRISLLESSRTYSPRRASITSKKCENYGIVSLTLLHQISIHNSQTSPYLSVLSIC